MTELFGPAIDRDSSDSIKWKRYADRDIIPMWVADMDFQVPQEIRDAIKRRIDHGVLGYGSDSADWRQSIVEHCKYHYRWEVQPAWIVPTPGVVKGLNIARALSAQRGKSAGITTLPVYPHLRFHSPILEFADRGFNTLLDNGVWKLDLDDMQANITADVGVMLFCNPHNPIGKVYDREELLALADVCEKQDLLICSDEIHCDLILNGKQHIPIASLSPEISRRTITLMAPSKTFNIAGLDAAFAIIEDPDLRQRYAKLQYGLVGHVNILGTVAAAAAFQTGEPWRQDLIAYLRENQRIIAERVGTIAGMSMIPSEATFLAWINISELQLDNAPKFFEANGVGFSPGSDFGDENYVRLNFGCQRDLLVKALDRMELAVRNHRRF